MRKLLKDNKELLKEYYAKKNIELDLNEISLGTHKKVWWKCVNGHEWEAEVCSRSKGHGCPYCNNLKAWSGYNDLATVNPELANEWNYEKNRDLRPCEVLPGSHKKVWWRCSNGHEWEAVIKDRTNGNNCPYCSNQKVWSGDNDLATVNPELVKEWDQKKNGNLKPNQILPGSEKKVWWKCAQGHSWSAAVFNRSKGVGCPYCSNVKVLVGYNDLATVRPELVQEWDFEKNENLKPSDVLSRSHKKVWWKCANGHQWKAGIKDRFFGNNCPYCANKKILIGYNDFSTTYSELAKEWSDKNAITPDGVIAGADKKYYWICPVGHKDYLMTIDQRKRGQGCPICAQQSQTSFPEQTLYYYVRCFFPDAINRYLFDDKKEIDIYIPSKQLGIEYDGYFSHKDKTKKDAEKAEYLRSKGITLIRVKEYKKEDECYDADFFIHERTTYESITNMVIAVISRLGGLEAATVVDCERDQSKIKEQYINSIRQNSIATAMPEIVPEWDCIKNGSIKPEYVSRNSGLKYYWICPVCGYSYLATPTNRYHGTGCPACAGKVIHRGFNDLRTRNPELIEEWDFEKNAGINPDNIFYRSKEAVWWKCKYGHSWQKSVSNRTKNKSICPYCTGRSVIKGYNDLKTKRPDLAEEWDYSLNNGAPDVIHYNNQTEQIHWICKVCGHKWIHTIKNRGRCPECLRQRTQINVYNVADLSFYGQFKNARALCEHFGLDYSIKQRSISNVCRRVRKTFMGKYILRYPIDDEIAKDK